MKKNVAKKTESLSDWYTDVILNSKMGDYSPVKGCMVIRPTGYGIWENIQKSLDGLLKNLGIENAYFPLFIPMSLLNREKDHVEGFSPELAVVTHGGGEKLAENLAVRPTSETIMYEMYHKWVNSYRDLPILLNQWNNAVRWEKRTYFFLRTTEFLWQEAHTAHATEEEAQKMVYDALEAYRTLLEDYMAIPVIKGLKSDTEKFAGAVFTTTIESLMPDGKSLQTGTSHMLGQNFSRKDAFDISFSDEKGGTSYAWQTSYGLSTRTLGALVMVHGNDNGLVLPPRIAPTQVLLIPVEDTAEINQKCLELMKEMTDAGVRTKIMSDTGHTLGWKFNECEIQGIPLYMAVGKKELESGSYTFMVRHSGEKIQLSCEVVKEEVPKILEQIQKDMFRKAETFRNSRIFKAETYDEFKEIMKSGKGFISAYWCGNAECEKQIKDETKASTRCLPFTEDKKGNGKCVKCGAKASHRWLFAQSY